MSTATAADKTFQVLHPETTYSGSCIRPPKRGLPKVTHSLCPECTRVIEALVFEENGKVMMEKTCPHHGYFKDTIFSDVKLYLKMDEWSFGDNRGVMNPNIPDATRCPDQCGLCSRHTSHTALANLDLTNRCNLTCPVCFEGDYRLIRDGDFSEFRSGAFDLVLSLFTFDNIAAEKKVSLFRGLGGLLQPGGRIVSVVSSPEIYVHEWASFSTKDFPDNRSANSGDVVRTIVTDHGDRRPVEDILCTDESYQEVYRSAGLQLLGNYKPLADGDEPYQWVHETRIAPWVVYVLKRAG